MDAGLPMWLSHPHEIARVFVFSSFQPDSATIRISDLSGIFRSSTATSKPFMRGIPMSGKTMSGSNERVRSMPSKPSKAQAASWPSIPMMSRIISAASTFRR